MVCGIASVIRRSSRSSSRSFFSVLFRSSMSVLLPNHLTTLPSASNCGTTRIRNQRYSPSYRRMRVSTPTFPLLQGQAGVLVPAFVQIFLGSIRKARPQERRNRVDDGLKPGSLLAELFESIAQFVVFRILGQLTHDRLVNRDVRTMLAVLKTGGIALNFRQTLKLQPDLKT